MKIVALTTLVCGLLLGPAQADKDDSYYIAGTGNPNREEKMYWKDAENVFQDLSKFSSLYVEFHNCAWSWMQTTDDGNDIEENDYWYMGKIPPMGANVAYSLYGSLKGETFKGCGEDTFINSFYTNSGFTNFARAMSYAGQSGFSSYTHDDDSYSKYTATCQGGYGVGCDYSNGFAVHTYSGDECNPADYTGVKDTLSSLNSAMEAATCVKIYDSSSYRGSPYGTALELLAYSHSCFYQDFFSPDGVCPDPYGKLKYYQKQFYNGIQESKKQDPYQVTQRKVTYKKEIKNGKLLTAVGLFLTALAMVIMLYECLVACVGHQEAEMRKFVPRQQDFIITRRSNDDEEDLETPTIVDKSDTDSENYVTMSHDEGDYMPPQHASPVVVSPPPIPSPQVEAPRVESPPVHVAKVPPPQVQAPQDRAPVDDVAPIPVFAPEVKVTAVPEVIAPVAVTPPPMAAPGNTVELKAFVHEEVIEEVTVFAPPSVVSKPKVDDTVPKIQVEVASVAPPSLSADEEDTEKVCEEPSEEPADEPLKAEEKQETSNPATEDASLSVELESVSNQGTISRQPVHNTLVSTPAAGESDPIVAAIDRILLFFDEPTENPTGEPSDEPLKAEENQETSNPPTDDAMTADKQEFNTSTSLSTTECPSSLPTGDIETEAPALSEAPSLKSVFEGESPEPLFAGISEASSERDMPEDCEKADDVSVPSLDEIIASREFDSDSDDDAEKHRGDGAEKLPEATTDSVAEGSKPESTSDFSQQAAASQYFDANEIEGDGEMDDIERCREESDEGELAEEAKSAKEDVTAKEEAVVEEEKPAETDTPAEEKDTPAEDDKAAAQLKEPSPSEEAAEEPSEEVKQTNNDETGSTGDDESPNEDDKAAAQLKEISEETSEEAKETNNDETGSTGDDESPNNEEEDEREVPKSSSWFSFTI